MAARVMAPLTREEQVFAAENHYIVDKYLRKRRLDPNEYYDVVVFRYLRSVKRWFSEPELHVHNFEIVAFYAMRSAIGHYQEKQRRQRQYGTVLSLDAVIDGTNGLIYSWNTAKRSRNTLHSLAPVGETPYFPRYTGAAIPQQGGA